MSAYGPLADMSTFLNASFRGPQVRKYCHQHMKIGQQQIAIAALAIGSFAAGYGVSFLRFRQP